MHPGKITRLGLQGDWGHQPITCPHNNSTYWVKCIVDSTIHHQQLPNSSMEVWELQALAVCRHLKLLVISTVSLKRPSCTAFLTSRFMEEAVIMEWAVQLRATFRIIRATREVWKRGIQLPSFRILGKTTLSSLIFLVLTRAERCRNRHICRMQGISPLITIRAYSASTRNFSMA